MVTGGYGRLLDTLILEILEIPNLVTVTGGYGRLREVTGYLDSRDFRDSRDSYSLVTVTGGYGRLREVTGYLDSRDSRDFRDSRDS